MTKPYSFRTKFIKKEILTPMVSSFYFRKIKGFTFLSGQYIKITLPIIKPDNRGSSRFFTISDSPLSKNYFKITTKKGRSSFKKKLFSLREGQEINVLGPIGTYVFSDKDSDANFFISGGMGITPFYSMIKYSSEKALPRSIVLIASFSKQSDFIFFEELKKIEKDNSNIKVIYQKNKISKSTIESYLTNKNSTKFMIAGPLEMVNSVKKLLTEMNVKEERILAEDFPGY